MRALLAGATALSLAISMAWGQETIDRRLPIAADASIRIHNMMGGSVRVSGWDRDTIVVTGTASPGRFFFGGGERAAKMGVDEDPAGRPGDAAHLDVRVPHRSRVWIKTASADIHVADVTGGLDLYSVSGGIRVAGRAGQVYAESMDGNVDVSAPARWVRAKTAAGSVTLQVSGGDVMASSVSGNVVIVGERLERARFESVTGDLRFEGSVDRGGALTFETHGGAVDLSLPASVSATFEVSTFHGRITNQLTRAAARPSRAGAATTLSFEAGVGGAEITVRSFKGDVMLRPHKPAK
jgi:hypothetical protein